MFFIFSYINTCTLQYYRNTNALNAAKRDCIAIFERKKRRKCIEYARNVALRKIRFDSLATSGVSFKMSCDFCVRVVSAFWRKGRRLLAENWVEEEAQEKHRAPAEQLYSKYFFVLFIICKMCTKYYKCLIIYIWLLKVSHIFSIIINNYTFF